MTVSRVPTREKTTWEAYTGIWRVFARLDFTRHLWLRPTCEWPQNSLPDVFKCAFSHTFTNTIQTLITHEIVRRTRSFSKKNLREKILAKHLRVRDCLPTIIYTISLKFPLLLPLHFHFLERFLTQTLTSPILSVERSFGAYGKHWKKPLSGGCNLELIAGSGQLVKTWIRKTCW